jgi:hypothetical protein
MSRPPVDPVRYPTKLRKVNVSSIRFPDGAVMKAGDTVSCEFTMHMDAEDMRLVEAVLIGTRDAKTSQAEQIAHILDSLAHLTKRISPWDKDTCSPRWHIERAIRELTHAMLTLEE